MRALPPGCIHYFSIAVIKHHEQGNVLKECFVWNLWFQSDKSQLLPLQEAWHQGDRHGMGVTPEISHLNPQTGGRRRALETVLVLETLNPTPVTYFIQQVHTCWSSHKIHHLQTKFSNLNIIWFIFRSQYTCLDLFWGVIFRHLLTDWYLWFVSQFVHHWYIEKLFMFVW